MGDVFLEKRFFSREVFFRKEIFFSEGCFLDFLFRKEIFFLGGGTFFRKDKFRAILFFFGQTGLRPPKLGHARTPLGIM